MNPGNDQLATFCHDLKPFYNVKTKNCAFCGKTLFRLSFIQYKAICCENYDLFHQKSLSYIVKAFIRLMHFSYERMVK